MYGTCLRFKSPWAYFVEQFRMVTSRNKSIQLCMSKAKATLDSWITNQILTFTVKHCSRH